MRRHQIPVTTGKNSKLDSPTRSLESVNNVKSILPPINKGNVKGLLQNISHDNNPYLQKTELGKNDLMNQSTLNHFIGKAFSTIDLKPGMMIKMETKTLPIGHEDCTDNLDNHHFKKTTT